jgi:hypothetical protein
MAQGPEASGADVVDLADGPWCSTIAATPDRIESPAYALRDRIVRTLAGYRG